MTTGLRILVAHSFYRDPGGEDRYVRQQIPLLARSHAVGLLSLDNSSVSSSPSAAANMVYSKRRRLQVEEMIEEFCPDVVHVHNVYPSFGPAIHLAAKRCGVPLVATIHNFRLRCPNGLMFRNGKACDRCVSGRYYNAVVRGCFPNNSQAMAYSAGLWSHRYILDLEDKVSAFVAPSKFMQERLHEWGIAPGRVKLVPNFSEVRSPLTTPGWEGVYAGRLSEEKGVGVLLEALRLAGDPPFVIAGEGPLREPLQERANNLGLQNTSFAGQLSSDALKALMLDCGYVVVPSLWDENAPLSALEAMALGRGLLVSDKGGLPELAGSGRGIVGPAGDPQILSEGILAFTGDARLRSNMGAKAWLYSRERMSAESHLTRLERLYREAIGTGVSRADEPSLGVRI